MRCEVSDADVKGDVVSSVELIIHDQFCVIILSRQRGGGGQRAARAGLTCPAGGVLEKVGKIVARREAGADGLPPLEVAREPGVSRRAGLKEVARLHRGRCARSHPARRRAGRWRTRGPCAGAP